MQSKNVLWLGVLFVVLLTTFCIAKYIDSFYPSIKTVTAPSDEIIDQDSKLQPVKITEIEDVNYTEEIDDNYLKVIQLVEQEEKDIEDTYNQALVHQVHQNKQTTKEQKPVQKKVVPKKRTLKKQKTALKKPEKLSIETVVASQTLLGFGKLSNTEKRQLKQIVQNFQKHTSSYLRIEADRKSNKFYSTKRYLAKLGVLKEKIQVSEKKYKSAISITHSSPSDIEISVIKKD